MHRQAAHVETALLLAPQDGAHHRAAAGDDGAAALLELAHDAGRGFLERARRRVGLDGLRRECEPYEVGDDTGVGGAGQAEGQPLLSIFAHVSRNPTARLKTRRPGRESSSTTK